MTDLSNAPTEPENDSMNEERQSPWVMLTSMTLLIAALLLTSAMLFHYGTKKGGIATDATAIDWSSLFDRGKTMVAKIPKPAPKTTAEASLTDTDNTKGDITKTLFGRNTDKSVKWPKLKLTGFGRSLQGDGDFAIINKEKVLEGGYVDGVLLVEIRSQDIVVEYKGERKTLTVDITN